MGAFIDRTGQRYGSLTAVSPVKRGRVIHWECRCDCGNVTYPTSATLGNGSSMSCGCSRKTDAFRANAKAKKTKHGYFGTPEYGVWGGIVDRCENPNSKGWDNYGGRGIRVDPVWRDNPVAFIESMGPRPTPKHSVERLDVNGPYAPNNCVWATQEEQSNNKRNNVILTFEGKTQTMAQWARELGISQGALRDRLKVRDVEGALNFAPVERGTKVEFNGESKLIREWAEELGFSRRGLMKRLKVMSIEEAFTKPKREWSASC